MVEGIANRPIIIQQPKENKTHVARNTLGLGSVALTSYAALNEMPGTNGYKNRLINAVDAFKTHGAKSGVKKSEFIKNYMKSAKLQQFGEAALAAGIIIGGALAIGTLIDAGINAIKNRKAKKAAQV